MTPDERRRKVAKGIRRDLDSGRIDKEMALSIVNRLEERISSGYYDNQEPVSQLDTPQLATNGAPQVEEDDSFLESIGKGVVGTGETALQLGTGMIAEPLSGLSGIAALALSRDPEKAARAVERTREFLTFDPITETGQKISAGVGSALAPVGEALTAAEEFSGDIGYKLGGPTLGAAFAALPTGIAEAIGIKGTKAAKKAAIAKEIEKTGSHSLLNKDVKDLFKKQGFTDRDINELVDLDASQLERLERFDRLGIQPTKGDITSDTAQRKAEQQLLETAKGESADKMRILRTQQSETIETNLKNLIDKTGVSDEVGGSIKRAIESRKKLTKQEASNAYKALAEAQQNADQVPVLIEDFRDIEGIPTGGDLRTIKVTGRSNFRALEDALAEFGLYDDEKALSRLASDQVVPQPLNLGNFEEFRQRLNFIERADQTGNIKRVTGPIKAELDNQIDFATSKLIESDNVDIASLAKNARRNWKAYKEEFDPKSLTESLIKNKPKSTIPFVEESQVYKKISANSTPIEQVDRVIESLKKEGTRGKKAVYDLQANMLVDLMDSMFTGATNKIGDVPVFSGAAFARKFNDPEFNKKLKLVFQDNPRALNELQDIANAIKDLTPGKLEIVKGSGNVILDVMNTIGLAKVASSIPGSAFMVEGFRELSARSKNRQALDKALDARPDFKRSTKFLASEYPMLATALGIGYLSGEDEE